MAFDDLADDPQDERDAGDEAMDDLAGTLSGNDSPSDPENTDANTDMDGYDPDQQPAFPSDKSRTQHSVYCLPDTWTALDGPSGLLFEAEIRLRRNGYGSVQKRELHNAFLQAAVEQLDAETIAETFVDTREQRVEGPLLKTPDQTRSK